MGLESQAGLGGGSTGTVLRGGQGAGQPPSLLRPPPLTTPLLHLTARGLAPAAHQPNNKLMKYLILLPVLLG